MKLPTSVILGLIGGIILCLAWYLTANAIGFYEVNVFIYVYIFKLVLILIGTFLSAYLLKRKNKGFLEFKSALQTGMMYCLVFAVVIAIFNYFYYKFITPDTIDFYLAEAKRYAETTAKLTGEELTKFLDAERGRFGSFTLVPPILFWGLIMSLISGLIFQKKNPASFGAN